jgi:hypothetical protein
MEQWIKLPSVRKADVTPNGGRIFADSTAKSALRIAIKKFVNTVNCDDGYGMKLVKVHSVLHVPDDVLMFGSGKNWDSGPLESNHKENVKRKAELTNLCKDTLEDQVATRFEESLVIEHAKGIIMGNDDNTTENHPVSLHQECTGSRIKLIITSTEGNPCYNVIKAAWDGKKNSKFGRDCTLPLPSQVALEYLLRLVSQAHENCPESVRPTSTSPLFVHCFTDHKTFNRDGKPQIYRAHPSYRGMLPWNNWVYVEYCVRTDGRRRSRNVFEKHLSKIILFIDFSNPVLPNMTNIEGYVSPGLYALVQTIEEEPAPVRDSVLLSTCMLSNEFYLVPTSSFSKPAFVVDNDSCENRSLFVVPSMDEWAELFV